MMNIPEFKPPLFLQNQSVDEIHSKMLGFLPDSLDKSEGQFPWEFTRPTALQKSEMVEFVLMEAIKSIYPMWSEKQVLDYHALCRGMTRKPATASTGTVTVTAIEKTVIPKGCKFLTPATYEKAGVVFSTDYEVTVAKLPVKIHVTAVTKGIIGNVATGTITLMDSPMEGILSITNEQATIGGIEEESDDELRARIMEYDQNQGVSFVGSLADYKRWAEEVKGVGSVKAYPAADNSGKVTIVVMDSNDGPANAQLIKQVSDHIMRPDSPMERLAPVNAILEVKAPSVKKITIVAGVRLDAGYNIEQVKTIYLTSLKAYSRTADAAEKMLYDKLAGILIQTEGVLEYTNLLVNNAKTNVPLTVGEMVVFDVTGVVIQI